MAQANQHNNAQLMAIRRTIESVFSLLSYYNVENNRARSFVGFQERLKLAILAPNMEYTWNSLTSTTCIKLLNRTSL